MMAKALVKGNFWSMHIFNSVEIYCATCIISSQAHQQLFYLIFCDNDVDI